MRVFWKYLVLLWTVILFSFIPPRKPVSIYLIGDSTMADYSLDSGYMEKKYPIYGWGQVFQSFFDQNDRSSFTKLFNADRVQVINKARGGRSTRTFFEEGRWWQVHQLLKKGDLVLIQFGHNDASVEKTERYVNPKGYQEFLRLYVRQTREKGGIPILVTPVNRNYPWKDGKLGEVHGEYPNAMKEVAKELNVLLIDLTQLSIEAFTTKGQEYVTARYFMNLDKGIYKAYPDGLKDNTHFQKEGAEAVAELVFNAMKGLKK